MTPQAPCSPRRERVVRLSSKDGLRRASSEAAARSFPPKSVRERIATHEQANDSDGPALAGPRAPARPTARRARPGVEAMEGRTLMAIDVTSAFALGFDTITVNVAKVDAAGNTYIGGSFSGTKVNFAQNGGTATALTGGKLSTPFVAKYSADGSLVWADPFQAKDPSSTASGSVAGQVSDLIIDSSGAVTAVGAVDGVTDFDPGASTRFAGNSVADSGSDAFIVRLKPSGDLDNVRVFDDGGDGAFLRAAFDSAGNVVVTGAFSGSEFTMTTGDKGTRPSTPAGTTDAIVVKFDPSFHQLWSAQLGVSAGVRASGTGVALDASDNVYVVGVTDEGNAVIVRLNALGSPTAAPKFIGASTSPGSSALAIDVSTDSAGNAYVAGNFQGSAVNFNPGGDSRTLDSAGGTTDAFIAKYDSTLNNVWADRFGSAATDTTTGASDTVVGLGIDASNNLYFAGQFVAAASYGQNGSAAIVLHPANEKTVNGDLYVAQVNADTGAFVAGKAYGGEGEDALANFAVTKDGKAEFSGTYTPNLTLAGKVLGPLAPVDVFLGTLTPTGGGGGTTGGGGGTTGGGGGTTGGGGGATGGGGGATGGGGGTVLPAPAPHVSGVAGIGRSKGKISSITLAFDEALSQTSAESPGFYGLALGVKKRRKLVFSKHVNLGGISYDSNAHTVTLKLRKPTKGTFQVVAHAGITAANGQASSGEFSAIVK